ncbi:cysteine/glutathione ABC transporter ATP-binding protein/permease CydC [Vibrio sp.]|nr:cysteine/glutathione ABC transporter ATP-binding protein/permease CydC [Vibrio sp.]
MRDLIPYLQLFRKHWASLSLGMALSLITVVASIGLLALSGWFLSAAALAGLAAITTFNYLLPGAGVRGFAITRTAGRWAERVTTHNATFKLLTELRVHFFKKLFPLFPGKIGQIRDADLLNRLVSDVDAMDHVYLRLITPISVAIIGSILLASAIAWVDLQLGLTLGSILLVLLFTWPILFYQLGKKNGHQLTNNKAALRIATLDWLQGYSELTLFGAEHHYRQKIINKQIDFILNQYVNAHLSGLAQGLMILLNGFSLLLILWLSADGVGGQLPDPMIAFVVFATMASVELIAPIAGSFQYLGQTLTSARRLNEVVDAEIPITFPRQDASHANEFDIKLDSIDFHYPDNPRPVLKKVSLDIKAGQTVAILGKTGSGKSTVLQLITRFFDPSHGNITIADTSLKLWSEKQLRQSISVVSQRVDILNGTLKDNLIIANKNSTDGQLQQALANVGLEHLLDEKGLSTWLGEGGRQLSGGERRRIGIVRALLHDAPIVLLDEPTEGLDKQTEQSILALLHQHFQDKTVIFITHRLANLNQMDNIVLIDSGEIIEQGHHNDLIQKKGAYYSLTQRI